MALPRILFRAGVVPDVGTSAFTVYVFLRERATRRGDDIVVRAGVRRLKTASGMHHGTIAQALKRLEDAGWIRGELPGPMMYLLGGVVRGSRTYFADQLAAASMRARGGSTQSEKVSTRGETFSTQSEKVSTRGEIFSTQSEKVSTRGETFSNQGENGVNPSESRGERAVNPSEGAIEGAVNPGEGAVNPSGGRVRISTGRVRISTEGVSELTRPSEALGVSELTHRSTLSGSAYIYSTYRSLVSPLSFPNGKEERDRAGEPARGGAREGWLDHRGEPTSDLEREHPPRREPETSPRRIAADRDLKVVNIEDFFASVDRRSQRRPSGAAAKARDQSLRESVLAKKDTGRLRELTPEEVVVGWRMNFEHYFGVSELDFGKAHALREAARWVERRARDWFAGDMGATHLFLRWVCDWWRKRKADERTRRWPSPALPHLVDDVLKPHSPNRILDEYRSSRRREDRADGR